MENLGPLVMLNIYLQVCPEKPVDTAGVGNPSHRLST